MTSRDTTETSEPVETPEPDPLVAEALRREQDGLLQAQVQYLHQRVMALAVENARLQSSDG